MEKLSLAQQVAVWALPVLFAITVHEVAHGWVARLLGDPTAMMLGRLTLNPIKHIDPLGTVLLPALMLLLGGFIFGWARPVPVTVENLKRPRRDMALVAAAGPAANLLMGVGWALVGRLGLALYGVWPWVGLPLVYMAAAGIFINLLLMLVNLLPVPPLDGGRVLAGVLPGPLAYRLSRAEPYGLLVVVALLATGLLGQLLGPVLSLVAPLLARVAGMPDELLDAVLYTLTA